LLAQEPYKRHAHHTIIVVAKMHNANVPIYLINLARDVERREWMQSQLGKLGLQAIWIEAVLGKALSAEQRDALYDANANGRRYHLPLTAGEIGCYASHLKVWQALVDSKQAMALVLEDDMLVHESLAEVLQLASTQLKAECWDMIKLIGRLREPKRTSKLIANFELIRYQRVPSYTGAYLISRTGAEKLLATRARFARPVDVDLRFWWENDLDIYGLLPYPCDQAPISEQSSIGGKAEKAGWAYRWRRSKFNVHLNAMALWSNCVALKKHWPVD
jgi:glycosyl transferase, family 25